MEMEMGYGVIHKLNPMLGKIRVVFCILLLYCIVSVCVCFALLCFAFVLVLVPVLVLCFFKLAIG